MRIGAQLYTVRDYCKDLDSFALSLKKVADIGYRYVQVSGTCEFDPHWLKSQLDKNGLQCVLTHTPAEKLLQNAEQVASDHDVFDCEYVGLGWNAFDLDSGDTPENFVKKYMPVATALNRCGKLFMYHNHDQEFKRVDSKLILDHLAESFSPELMGFTLDTFWVQAGGGDPAWWLRHMSKRVPVIHLKDFAYGKKMAVIGEGNINFDGVFKSAAIAGTKHMLVEQDDCYGEDPFECLKRSYEYLKANGFE